MIDYFNNPINELNTQIFYTNSSGITSTSEWQIWQKPKNCKFVYFMVIGGGSGGGGGASGLAGTTRNGGGGGGSSAVTKGLFPANLLPDILYVFVGKGGNGGAAATSGETGSLSYVSSQPNKELSNLLLVNGTGVPTGGFITGGGSPGSAFNQFSAILSFYGVIGSNGGNQGGNPGSSTGATETQDMCITGGGAPGAGVVSTSNPGGSIAQGLFTPTINGGSAGRNSGFSGVFSQFPSINSMSKSPLYFTGGSGGGSNNGGVGGDGGNGSYGSGGGGGGAGTTGGSGGSGGNGLVIITSL